VQAIANPETGVRGSEGSDVLPLPSRAAPKTQPEEALPGRAALRIDSDSAQDLRDVVFDHGSAPADQLEQVSSAQACQLTL
jgi:hypothetical protein